MYQESMATGQSCSSTAQAVRVECERSHKPDELQGDEGDQGAAHFSTNSWSRTGLSPTWPSPSAPSASCTWLSSASDACAGWGAVCLAEDSCMNDKCVSPSCQAVVLQSFSRRCSRCETSGPLETSAGVELSSMQTVPAEKNGHKISCLNIRCSEAHGSHCIPNWAAV